MKTLTNLSWSQARDLAKQGYSIWRDPWTGTRKIKRPKVGTREGNLWYHVPWSGSPASVVVSAQFTASEFLARDWCCGVPDGALTPDDGPDMPEGYIPICRSDCNPFAFDGATFGDVHIFIGRILVDDNCPDVDGKMICLLGSDIDSKKIEIWYGQAEIVSPAGGYMVDRIILKDGGETGEYYIDAGKFYSQWSTDATPTELAVNTVANDYVQLDNIKDDGDNVRINVRIIPKIASPNNEHYFELAWEIASICGLPNMYGVLGMCMEYLTQGNTRGGFVGIGYDGIGAMGSMISGGAWSKAAISATDAEIYTGPKFTATEAALGRACIANGRLPIPELVFPYDPFLIEPWWVVDGNDSSSGGGVGEP